TFLILEEPMAGMNQEEKEYMARFILDARDEMGVTVFLIEHHMDPVTGICDRMVALSYGEMLAEGSPKEVITHPRVIEAYLGGSH
ncbi:MAG TPA: ABC transporter ATP-binding protein, partial [Gammaproteobacteria bacterium]|nr:ABC transporter ATP-binding protein [Gammaproteobacteria bacterium]